jgi:hypothetical protein
VGAWLAVSGLRLIVGSRFLGGFVIGYWLLAIGYWLLAIGYWLLAIGYWLLAIGYWLLAMREALPEAGIL